MTNIPDPNDTSLPSPEALRRALAEQGKPRKRVKKGAEKPAAEPTPEMLLTRCASPSRRGAVNCGRRMAATSRSTPSGSCCASTAAASHYEPYEI